MPDEFSTLPYYTLDKDNNAVPGTLAEYVAWTKGLNKDTDLLRWTKQVDDTTIDDSRISTVFLGIDHNWGAGPPVLWETMVFGGELDQEQVRYRSHDAAVVGHKVMVKRVKAAR